MSDDRNNDFDDFQGFDGSNDFGDLNADGMHFSEEELEAFVRETLEKEKLSSMAVAGIASVDVKADEVGILALAEQLAVPFLTYPAGRLQCVDGTFTSSGFVAQQVGVDNVCERAAVCAAGEGGRLLVQKAACEGKTLAIAEKKWSVKF